jgi:hypothetical protein
LRPELVEGFGGVPISILYDNLKIAVARILGDGNGLGGRAQAGCRTIKGEGLAHSFPS